MRVLVLLLGLVSTAAAQYKVAWVYGPGTAYRGKGSTYVQFHFEFSDTGTHIYWKAIDGLPSGVSFQRMCQDTYAAYGSGDAQWCWMNSWNKTADIYLRLTADRNVAQGAYPVTVRFESAGYQSEVSFRLAVKEPPPAPPEPPLHRVPIPAAALTTWKSWVETPGYGWCAAGGNILVPYEGAIWYYDGGDGFFSAADILGDPARYRPCGFWVVNSWRDYLLRLGYLNAGWRVFVHGLYRAWKETGDPSYAKAIDVQANHSFYTYSTSPLKRSWSAGEAIWTGGSRESFYRVQAYTFYEKTGGPREIEQWEKRPKIVVTADRAIFTLDRLLYSPVSTGVEFQSWQYGIGMRCLIDYYEHTKNEPQGPDTRVLDYVMAGVRWAYWHRNAAGAVLHNPQPKGPLCYSYCSQYVSLDNAFLAPAAAWLWRKTGNDFYRIVADALFVGLTKWTVETQKQWSQTMYWIPDYYRWRTEGLL